MAWASLGPTPCQTLVMICGEIGPGRGDSEQQHHQKTTTIRTQQRQGTRTIERSRQSEVHWILLPTTYDYLLFPMFTLLLLLLLLLLSSVAIAAQTQMPSPPSEANVRASTAGATQDDPRAQAASSADSCMDQVTGRRGRVLGKAPPKPPPPGVPLRLLETSATVIAAGRETALLEQREGPFRFRFLVRIEAHGCIVDDPAAPEAKAPQAPLPQAAPPKAPPAKAPPRSPCQMAQASYDNDQVQATASSGYHTDQMQPTATSEEPPRPAGLTGGADTQLRQRPGAGGGADTLHGGGCGTASARYWT